MPRNAFGIAAALVAVLATTGCAAHSTSMSDLGSLSTSKQQSASASPSGTSATAPTKPPLPYLLTDSSKTPVTGDHLPKFVLLPNDARQVRASKQGVGERASWRVEFTSGMTCATYEQQLTGHGFGDGLDVSAAGFAVRGRPYDLTVLCGPATMTVLANPYMT